MEFFPLAFQILAFVSYAIFIWGVWGVFKKHDSKDPMGLKFLKMGFTSSTLWVLYFLWVSPPEMTPYSLAATVFYFLSLLVFIWAAKANRSKPLTLAFSSDSPSHLMQEGPYAYVRHPFYTAYILSFFAPWLGTLNWVFAPTALLILGIYWTAARTEEKKFLDSSLKEEYQSFQSKTGMFFPSPFKILSS